MATLVSHRLPLIPPASKIHASQLGSVSPSRHDVVTTLNYWKDPGDGSAPLPIIVGDTKVTNERPTIAFQVTVEDVTGQEGHFTLDSHGFQFCRHESNEKLFNDEQRIKCEYFPEAEKLLRHITGAFRVHVFDYKVRRGPSYWHQLGQNNVASRGPLRRVHIDQSYHGAELVLRKYWPEENDALMERRWQIINLWRPIKTIHQDPLAVADSKSVPEADLAATSMLDDSGEKKAETWTVRPNAAHRWYFKYEQTPDEVVLIKCFDSAKDIARRAPQCAFEDPAYGGDEGCRESVEVRALLVY
ncbi:hypothetical protein JX265_012085 [Neoarthrinium moseri]|uniref:Uncharacterized protein n=1 Tax=Neoarthrinium moseri TaxID=1658444 RepID=A0A9P9WBE1_9PEZI|nr:hypothetical protein JX265_012085 [Neoarthrinium moseri]